MPSMGGGIPHGAVAVSVVVLIYSIVCLTCSSLVVAMLLACGEQWKYVTLLCSFAALSTLASIVQQFHYAFAWEVIKQCQFDQSVRGPITPVVSLGGATRMDAVLFDIQFYCYNAMALNVLFWSLALFCRSWGIRASWMGTWQERVSPIAKIFAVIFPSTIVGLSHSSSIARHFGLYFALTNGTMLGSFTVGGIMLVLILYKYMKTRRLLARPGGRGAWWASRGSEDRFQHQDREFRADGTMESGVPPDHTQGSIYDRALIIRFTIGFIILAIFEVMLIIFFTVRQNSNRAMAKSRRPDHSTSNAITDILFFIPGVTASLVVFLVFGTTKSWNQYRDLVGGSCCVKRKIFESGLQRIDEGHSRGLEFKRLPSPPPRDSGEDGIKVEKRVKVFVTSNPLEPERQSPEFSTTIRADKPSGFVQAHLPSRMDFHKRDYADMSPSAPSSQNSSAVMPIDLKSTYSEDPIIQRGVIREERRHGLGLSPEPRRYAARRVCEIKVPQPTDF